MSECLWEGGSNRWSSPIPFCPVSCRCPWKKTLIEKKFKTLLSTSFNEKVIPFEAQRQSVNVTLEKQDMPRLIKHLTWKKIKKVKKLSKEIAVLAYQQRKIILWQYFKGSYFTRQSSYKNLRWLFHKYSSYKYVNKSRIRMLRIIRRRSFQT